MFLENFFLEIMKVLANILDVGSFKTKNKCSLLKTAVIDCVCVCFVFCFLLFPLSLSQESAAQSASSEENATSEITKKIGMEVTFIHVNE